MEWTDEAIVLAARPHGETAAIVSLLTANHGRHAGLVQGGQGSKTKGLLQSGNHVQARWRARLLDHLGTCALDSIAAYAAPWLDNPEVLSIIASACAVTEAALPERQPMPGVYAGLLALLGLPDADLWGPSYVKWEIGVLRSLGYGLDLTKCAVSGETEGLTHVSPRTGRAVTAAVARPYKEKLLPIPPFLLGESGCNSSDVLMGLELTGYFLSTHVFGHSHGRMASAEIPPLPPARLRLAEIYRKR